VQPIYVILDNSVRVGATVIGRRTFDLGVGPRGGMRWPGIPSVVVTHRARQDLLGNNGGMFAFDGLEAAVRRAKQAAGDSTGSGPS
jgi:dihydrofolate reductase